MKIADESMIKMVVAKYGLAPNGQVYFEEFRKDMNRLLNE